jgi:DNA-binding HxlR family transcriptional regulator
MKGYGQYCPIARGAEIFAERWTPIIVRNLLTGCTSFGEIQDGAPGIPRSLLSQRLRLLEHHGVVERRTAGRRATYHLTDCGTELASVCHALGVWGARWLETVPSPFDAHLAVWFWSRLVDRERLPKRRIVVRFDLVDDPSPTRYWVLLSRADTEVCVQAPGYPDDLVVTTETAWLVKWHTGLVSLGAAQRADKFSLDGPRWLVREFPRWGGLSPFAGIRKAVG